MLTIQYAKDPFWADEANTIIHLTVKFEEIDTELPFGANSYDPMPYGIELFNNAVAGNYGSILPYNSSIAPNQPTTTGTQTA